jgi:hypothetical protein
MNSTESENKLAATVTPEEIKFLFEHMPKSTDRVERVVWSESIRAAYRQMRLED